VYGNVRLVRRSGVSLAHESCPCWRALRATWPNSAPLRPETVTAVKAACRYVGETSAGYRTPLLNVPDAVYHRPAFDAVWRSGWTMIFVGLLIPAMLALAVIIPMRHRGSTVRARVSDYVTMPSRRKEADAKRSS